MIVDAVIASARGIFIWCTRAKESSASIAVGDEPGMKSVASQPRAQFQSSFARVGYDVDPSA